MDSTWIAKYWYADIYEQMENQTHDVEFLLKVLEERAEGPQNILEVACGGGRIAVPLAQAGHRVTGIDADVYMLQRCYRRARGLSNIRCYLADATQADWGGGYDLVVLAGNILINIESGMDYREAQRTFLQKAAQALRPGGAVYLDFDLHSDPAAVFNHLGENSYFEGEDDQGTWGRTVSYGSTYDPVTRLCCGSGHVEIRTHGGETLILPEQWQKHIPSQRQVWDWLEEVGLRMERTYLNFTGASIPEPWEGGDCRAGIWARKG